MNLLALRVPIFLASLISVSAHPSHRQCKESHLSAGWPSLATWSQFNATLGGNLIRANPPASVCYSERPEYSDLVCTSVTEQWPTALFHDSDPVSLHQSNWQNDACIPPQLYNGTSRCNLGSYAQYVVNASKSQHVVDAVRFGNAHNLRLSVKNTGHDYLGRSTSPDFQIWTHYLKGIEAHKKFQPKDCPGHSPVPAITVHGGNQYGEIYNFTAKHGILIAGGADPSVGVGGHFTGGGHSPFGALLGLAVDNALEMQVVTPSGELVTANQCQNSDLFWAMRGGGGSTFGILISVTEKAYQDFPSVAVSLEFHSSQEEATMNNNTNFYSVLADMHSEIVNWSDHYLTGYYAWSPSSVIAGVVTGDSIDSQSAAPQPMTMQFNGYGLNQTVEQINQTMWKFSGKLNTTEGVSGLLNFTMSAKSNELLNKVISSGAGRNAYLASRLWDKEAMVNRTGLLKAFRALEPNGVRGLLVSGPAVRDATKIPATSVTPAWRKTYQHNPAGVGWPYRNDTANKAARKRASEIRNVLQDHAPDMGAYLNEADASQPDPGYTFWGDNYARLLKLKREMDPNAVFWCKPCVGFEDWEWDELSGRLCRVDMAN